MQYMLLIYDDEQAWAGMTPEQTEQIMKQYLDYTTWLQDRGWFKAGDPLQPTSTAKTVSAKSGEQVVTDGPFAETKEQLGGYYLLDCSLEEALDAAGRLPVSRFGSVEVRPLLAVPGQEPGSGV